MKKTRRWIVLIFVVLGLVDLHSLGSALDSEFSRGTLRGLKGVHVVVENVRPEIERNGLTRDQLQTDTELKLRMAGIKVLSKEERLRIPGMPYIYVCVNAFKSEYGYVYIYNSCVELIQSVSLLRTPNIKGEASTWSVCVVGVSPTLEDVRNSNKDLVDRFINAYLSVNPK